MRTCQACLGPELTEHRVSDGTVLYCLICGFEGRDYLARPRPVEPRETEPSMWRQRKQADDARGAAGKGKKRRDR